MKKEHITVFTGDLTRHLLRKGYVITDVKAHRKLDNGSVFIFKNDDGLIQEIHKYRNER